MAETSQAFPNRLGPPWQTASKDVMQRDSILFSPEGWKPCLCKEQGTGASLCSCAAGLGNLLVQAVKQSSDHLPAGEGSSVDKMCNIQSQGPSVTLGSRSCEMN